MEDGSRERSKQNDGKENPTTCVSHCAANRSCFSLPLRLLTTVLLFLISIIYPYLPLQQVFAAQNDRAAGKFARNV